jgi:2-oxoglutarate ferredoxin oxidoreductase subunit beta
MYGHIEHAFSISELAVTAGAAFVARSTVYHAALADQLIEQAMIKPGFAVVEIISNCHMQYGRRNKIGNAIDMLTSFKEQAVTVKKATTMEEEELQGKITIGVLADRDLPVSTDEYKRIREQARSKQEGK